MIRRPFALLCSFALLAFLGCGGGEQAGDSKDDKVVGKASQSKDEAKSGKQDPVKLKQDESKKSSSPVEPAKKKEDPGGGKGQPDSKKAAPSSAQVDKSDSDKVGKDSASPPEANTPSPEQRPQAPPFITMLQESEKAFQNNELKKGLELVRKAVKAMPENNQINYVQIAVILDRRAVSLNQTDGKTTEEIIFEVEKILDKFFKVVPLERLSQIPGEQGGKIKMAIASLQYNVACAYSRRKQPETALKKLKSAVDLGFEDLKLLTEDDDMSGIRDTPEFKKLLATVKARQPGASTDAAKPDAAKPDTAKPDAAKPDKTDKKAETDDKEKNAEATKEKTGKDK